MLFPQFSLRVARIKGTTRDEFLDNRQYAGNAFALMRRFERFLIDWLPVAGKMVPGQMARIDTPELPPKRLQMLFEPHESKPWNPWIAKVFHRRGLIETWGRGTLKMAGLMQEAGLQPPTVAVQGDCVMLTFRLAQRLGNTASKALVIGSEKSSEKVLSLLQAQPQLSAKTLADQLGISSRAVAKQIDLLKKSGRLQRIGPAKGGYWKVISNE